MVNALKGSNFVGVNHSNSHFSMRKQSLLFLVCAILLGAAQPVSAQSFWKKVGKAAKSALEAASSIAGSSSGSSLSSSDSGSSASIPGININLTSCEFWGNWVCIDFTATNETSKTVQAWVATGSDVALDENGTQHHVSGVFGGQTYFLDMPPGVPVKGYLVIDNVDRGTQQIMVTKLNVRTNESSLGKDYSLKLPTMTVTYPDNTNAKNITCGLPLLQFDYKSCKRNGTDVVVEGVFTNIATKDLEIAVSGTPTVYDPSGDSYKTAGSIGDAKWEEWSNRLTIPKELSKRCTLTIKNVPTSITQFSYIKLPFEYGNTTYYVEIRKQTIN